jgi:4-amino-4-deoxy-L-arabinose transferase-like glycosyltransferase
LANHFLPRPLYTFFFFLLGIVYCIGLFVPLIDNDSAHHASMALHMHLTGDYASLVDWKGDYLDKPHLLFWLAAFSYKIFGVTAFAYKLPTFLFTILGIYSTYRLGKSLYHAEAGRLAALLLASSFAFIIAVSDVRMDGILTATIAFSTWQLVAFVQHKRLMNIVLAALGLALAFSTKGHIGVFVPAVGILFYILYRREYNLFLSWKWLLLIVLFFLFISPVLYAYYLQYNLHPEKVIRGKDHINGVKFILFNQSLERFSGGMGDDSKNDYLFFIHSFLWAFAPWSLLTILAIVFRLRNISKRTEEWGTIGAFLAVFIIVTFSGFKLPHYLNVVFPVAAVMAAVFLLQKMQERNWMKRLYLLHLLVSIALLVFAGVANAWAFPVKNIPVLIALVLLLALVFYFILSRQYTRAQKAVAIPVSASILFFFLMNANFYPQLLKYQAGQQLAKLTRGKVDPADVYIEKDSYAYSSSYVFYSKDMFRNFDDSLLGRGKKTWLLTEPAQFEKFRQGYQIGTTYEVPHFRVTKLNLAFLNPKTRDSTLSKMIIIEILSKK